MFLNIDTLRNINYALPSAAASRETNLISKASRR